MKLSKIPLAYKKEMNSCAMLQMNVFIFLVAFFATFGKMGGASFVEIAQMILLSFLSFQVFQMTCEMKEIKFSLNKAATSISHFEISSSLSCGNLVKILRSHFEKLSYIEIRLTSLVGDRHDAARVPDRS